MNTKEIAKIKSAWLRGEISFEEMNRRLRITSLDGIRMFQGLERICRDEGATVYRLAKSGDSPMIRGMIDTVTQWVKSMGIDVDFFFAEFVDTLRDRELYIA